jgi:UDP-N-acetylmuramoyl-tripeptide--D-alanyl-D-alanine ligase
MIGWDGERVAAAAGAELLRGASRAGGPRRCSIDSREVQPGDLFVGLRGERVDGGAYAERALRAGAWGVLVAPEYAPAQAGGAVLTHPDPLAAMQSLARAWRKALGEEGAKVVAITGSTGKTSTKDILAGLLRDAKEELGGHTVASEANLNTEIGLPLVVLAAPAGTRALVLEMAMRGRGQIAELTAIAQPEVGVIVNVGPVHLEQLGTIEAVAAAKAELIAGMAPGATAVIPAGESLLAPHLRTDQHTVTFGEGGDVELVGSAPNGEVTIADHARGGERIVVRPSFTQSHNLLNLLAAVAAARALGVTPRGRLDVEFSALRGERIALANGIVLINDCYNANPMSMRAALDDLAASQGGRRVAVLGDMLELGGQERRMHREIGAYARARGVELLLTVGPLASEMRKGEGEGAVYSVPGAAEAAKLLGRLLRAGDVVLVKGSRGMELERVAQALTAEPVGGDSQGSGSRPPRPGSDEQNADTPTPQALERDWSH